MITNTRRLAAELRSVFRRLGGTARGSGPALCISTAPDGMRVSTRICDVAAWSDDGVPGRAQYDQMPPAARPDSPVHPADLKDDTPVNLRQIKTLDV